LLGTQAFAPLLVSLAGFVLIHTESLCRRVPSEGPFC
jgi:hypothetical protein